MVSFLKLTRTDQKIGCAGDISTLKEIQIAPQSSITKATTKQTKKQNEKTQGGSALTKKFFRFINRFLLMCSPQKILQN
jgi:hypothetical protein